MRKRQELDGLYIALLSQLPDLSLLAFRIMESPVELAASEIKRFNPAEDGRAIG